MSDDEIEAINQRKMADLQKAAAEKAALSAIKQPLTLTDSNFNAEVSRYPILVVDFWAPWCGPCRMVAPVIDQLAKDYSGRVVFGKVNVDENQIIANKFGIQSIPTMMVFKNGKVVDVMIGAMPKPQIEMKIKQQLSGNSGIYG
ncbi:MAG: thioredoxin [Nitrososphaera sp.]|nr:thioredoxin [Nitrososphaera sp.]